METRVSLKYFVNGCNFLRIYDNNDAEHICFKPRRIKF